MNEVPTINKRPQETYPDRMPKGLLLKIALAVLLSNPGSSFAENTLKNVTNNLPPQITAPKSFKVHQAPEKNTNTEQSNNAENITDLAKIIEQYVFTPQNAPKGWLEIDVKTMPEKIGERFLEQQQSSNPLVITISYYDENNSLMSQYTRPIGPQTVLMTDHNGKELRYTIHYKNDAPSTKLTDSHLKKEVSDETSPQKKQPEKAPKTSTENIPVSTLQKEFIAFLQNNPNIESTTVKELYRPSIPHEKDKNIGQIILTTEFKLRTPYPVDDNPLTHKLNIYLDKSKKIHVLVSVTDENGELDSHVVYSGTELLKAIKALEEFTDNQDDSKVISGLPNTPEDDGQRST